ncbi:MAG TPA: hypothetical protein VNO31_04345, partial [Umezawaea sp.]|nr:hypothetical protein [Umezawaea sp.]
MTIRSPQRPATRADYPDLPAWPQWSLDKHGARMLHPVGATRRPDGSVTRSTVYRTAVMMMPHGVLTNTASCEQVDAELNLVGMSMKRSPEETWPVPELPEELDGLDGAARDRIPVPVVLFHHGRTTAEVDAWTGVRQIRLGVEEGRIDRLRPG